jgi:RimJ/RimL family protein N-acetyltransferase
MFPDLMRDDVFHFETKRLWLRWPRAADAAAIADFAADPDVAQMTAGIPHPCPPREAESFILKARAENAAGLASHLALTQKAAGHPVIGILSAHAGRQSRDVEIGYVMAPQIWGKGFATEAVRAMVEVIFNITPAMRIFAKSRTGNVGARRVLEKSGFVPIDARLDDLPPCGGPHPGERFELDRLIWQRGNGLRRMPPMVHQRRDGVPAEPMPAEILIAAAQAVPQC